MYRIAPVRIDGETLRYTPFRCARIPARETAVPECGHPKPEAHPTGRESSDGSVDGSRSTRINGPRQRPVGGTWRRNRRPRTSRRAVVWTASSNLRPPNAAKPDGSWTGRFCWARLRPDDLELSWLSRRQMGEALAIERPLRDVSLRPHNLN